MVVLPFLHNLGASMSKQRERVKFSTWRSFKRMFLWIIWFQFDEGKTTVFNEELGL